MSSAVNPYALTKGHFQSGSDAKSSARLEVHRLDIESDKQFSLRVEMAIKGMENGLRVDYDDPSFRVLVLHGTGMATITVEVVHGLERGSDENVDSSCGGDS